MNDDQSSRTDIGSETGFTHEAIINDIFGRRMSDDGGSDDEDRRHP